MPAVTIAMVCQTMQRWCENLAEAKETGDIEREVDHTIASIQTAIATLHRLCPPNDEIKND